MSALIIIVGFTGISLALTVTFIGPKPDLIIPIAATGLLAFIFKAISLRRKKRSQHNIAEIRRVLLEEVSNIRKTPSKNRLNEFVAKLGLDLDGYFNGLEKGPLMDQGLKALMEQDYITAVKLFEENAKTQLKEAAVSWFLEGNALYFQEEYKEAMAAYQKSTSFNPSLAKAWYNWGVTLEALGLPEKAKEKYEKAQERDTDPVEIESTLNSEVESPVPRQESMEQGHKSLELDTGLVNS